MNIKTKINIYSNRGQIGRPFCVHDCIHRAVKRFSPGLEEEKTKRITAVLVDIAEACKLGDNSKMDSIVLRVHGLMTRLKPPCQAPQDDFPCGRKFDVSSPVTVSSGKVVMYVYIRTIGRVTKYYIPNNGMTGSGLTTGACLSEISGRIPKGSAVFCIHDKEHRVSGACSGAYTGETTYNKILTNLNSYYNHLGDGGFLSKQISVLERRMSTGRDPIALYSTLKKIFQTDEELIDFLQLK